jgi:hypothetical protein
MANIIQGIDLDLVHTLKCVHCEKEITASILDMLEVDWIVTGKAGGTVADLQACCPACNGPILDKLNNDFEEYMVVRKRLN